MSSKKRRGDKIKSLQTTSRLKTIPLSRQYILFNKPFNVLSQFTSEGGKQSLKNFNFPEGVYPVGRLDYDSEGLLLLTNDNEVKHRLTDPRFDHSKTYLVQVERIPGGEALEKLRTGIFIEGKKTKPAEVNILAEEPAIPERTVPIRVRKNVPTAWIEITLREGRNRQVRKMTAAAGHPTLRLIRVAIGKLTIGTLQQGEWKSLSKNEIF